MKYLSVRSSLRSLILLLSLFIAFHLLVITGVIPFHIVWGGRLKTQSDMLRMESISILINFIMLSAAILRLRYFMDQRPPMLLRIVFWLMFFLFSLNTLGNLMAESLFEKALFTPITLILALLCLRIVMDKSAMKV